MKNALSLKLDQADMRERWKLKRHLLRTRAPRKRLGLSVAQISRIKETNNVSMGCNVPR